jgi:hypothetical protein
MSAQKRLSQLSVAAVALLVVALPCFAQSESTEKNSAASGSDNSGIVAVNRESVTRESRVEEKRVADADMTTKAPKFSATTFFKAAGEASAAASKPSISFQPIADRFERKESRPVNGFTFVASRGQTLPE